MAVTAAPATDAMRSCSESHFGRQRRLIADARRQTSQQARQLAPGLNEAEDVVHQQQHVLMLLVAEILGDRQRGQRHPPARARRFVHLPIDKYRAREHARALHVGQELMAFAGALPDPREDRDPLVFLDHGVDQLHDEHGLADAGAAEHRGLAALGEWREKVDHLDAGLEHRGGRGLILERRRRIVDAASRSIGWQGRSAVPHRPDHVEETTQNRISDWDRNWRTCRAHRRAAGEARGRLERDAADRRGIDMAMHFEDQRFRPVPFDDQRGVDRRKHVALEAHVHDGASNRHDRTH